MFCCTSVAVSADTTGTGETILLAQSTVTTNGVAVDPQSPRVISRPQVDVETTDQSGTEAANASVDNAPEWQNYLRDYLSDDQLAFMQDNILWLLLAAGALLLLPMILFSIISGRNRHVHPYDQYEPANHASADDKADISQSAMKMGDLDFDELDQPQASSGSQAVATNDDQATTEQTSAPATKSPEFDKDQRLTENSFNDTQMLNLQDLEVESNDATTAQAAADLELSKDAPSVELEAAQNSFASSQVNQAPLQESPAVENRTAVLTRFGKWLYELPPEAGREAAMEGFLYWVSYSAGNIRPGLKEELAQATELDEHGRIKRAVLSFQPEILHDIMVSLNRHLDQPQRQPFLDMMIAVLIDGNGIKPVENLLLRFYADFSGIGVTQLEDCYQQAHGRTLPGIPRPDRIKWWGQYGDSIVADQHNNAQQPWTLLGLDENADAAAVERVQRLVEYRHHPNRFLRLGERERSLVARSLSKYQAALESVTEGAS